VSLDRISIRGAREHNLKGFDLDIPRDQLVVITGLSGSGKSSLAFDTIYAEGQRRYVESLSAYARQFLGQMDKPDVDHIEGLSPAVSIDQKTTSKNPRSTVGTVTEIYDYLRLLFARVGVPHCPVCGCVIERQTPEQIVDDIAHLAAGTKFQVLAPVVKGRKGEYGKLLDDLRREGFTRVRVDGQARELAEAHIMVAYRREYAGGWRHPFIDASIATDLDKLMADRFIIGGPEQCIAMIRRFVEDYGMTHLICRTFFPGMPHARIMRGLELLAREVMPAFR
jgi:excinuclease ABC subunit A